MKTPVLLFTFFLMTLVHAIPAACQDPAPLGIRMIIVRTEAEANDIVARVQAGEKFQDLATSRSVDPSARAGGYLGVFAIGQLRPEFQSALDGISPGQISRIARLSGGFAVLQPLTNDETSAIELKKWIDAGKNPRSSSLELLWTIGISANNIELIKELIASGADVNLAFGDGSTVLMGAAQTGQIDIVRALLAAGAAVNAETMDGTTALLVAAQAGRAEIVRALLQGGAMPNVRRKDGAAPLMNAAFAGSLDAVNALIDSGADPNSALQNGSTALMAASVKGHNDIVRVLLGAGARVDAGINVGGTALMEAAYGGHADTVRILLEARAAVNAANSSKLTALMGAALGGHAEAVQVLLGAGADVSARDVKGWTALTYARTSVSSPTVRMLLDKDPSVSPQDRSLDLGGVYLNEYYSSNEAGLVDLAAAEFQKALNIQPRNAAALEWMGAVEFLRWDNAPSFEQFKKASGLLAQSADLDPKDPDRHYWIAAVSSIFASRQNGAPVADIAAILDQGIEHAKKAIELDPQFADGMDHLSVLYRLKSERTGSSAEKDQLEKLADSVHQDALRIRAQLGGRPSRFRDQFSRPALPPAPKM